jgi:hypothetical protein
MTVDTTWVKAAVANELGLVEHDIATLYGIQDSDLDQHLRELESTTQGVYQRVLSDVDAMRIGYRRVRVTDDHIERLRSLLETYPFHPLVGVTMWDGRAGWRLSADDAQYVAYRAADIVGLEFQASDALRLRLNTLVIWPAATHPTGSQAFRDRIVDVTTYLIELVGVI